MKRRFLGFTFSRRTVLSRLLRLSWFPPRQSTSGPRFAEGHVPMSTSSSQCESFFVVPRRRVSGTWNRIPRMVRFVFPAAAITCLLGIVSSVRSDEPERPPENAAARAKANLLIEDLLKEREKIVSAVVHVRGSQSPRRNDPPPEHTIRGMYAFDHAAGAVPIRWHPASTRSCDHARHRSGRRQQERSAADGLAG